MDVVQDLLYHLNNFQGQNYSIGAKIQEENKDIFKQWFVALYNQKTANQNSFEYVKDKLKIYQPSGDVDFTVDQLLAQFTYYKNAYDSINEQIALAKQDKISLTNLILKQAQDFKNKNNSLRSKQIVWSQQQKLQLLDILANVSAVWTIIDRQIQNQGENQGNSRFIHTIQIITIMRLLNIDTQVESTVYNHIAQVRTGEGKSIALGITSTIFALIGFKVDCCCYSQYLSERDFEDFEKFFINFSIEKDIQYNTFSKLTEKIINHPNDFRKLGENYLSQSRDEFKYNPNNQEPKKVLIIDEIDFFFGENFLGQVYAVGYQYTNDEVFNLFKLLWKKKYQHINMDTIKNSNEYKNLFQKQKQLLKLQDFIDNKIEQMIKDSQQMESHTYALNRPVNSVENMIGYKDIDRISYETVKGYKTAFAHIQEWQRKKINSEQLKKKLCFNFNLGCFSYLKMIESYSLVLGVTGTLDNMTIDQKKQMKEICNIEKSTITPSVFGESKFQFDQSNDVELFKTKEEYFQQILEKIDEVVSANRSVLVFFENQQILFEFSEYLKNKSSLPFQILYEQTPNKKSIINKASYQKVITLSTKPFGRGTDFKCYDKTVIQSGGIHAISTFLSSTLAEQIQIQGRVARNGDPGSFSLYILESDLDSRFKFDYSDQSENNLLYDQLNIFRNSQQTQRDQELEKKQIEAEIYHYKSIQLKKLLDTNQFQNQEIKQLLIEIASYGDSKENKISKPNQFYNNFSEEDFKNADKDKFNNPIGDEFDLGKKGQFKDFSILIGQFVIADGCDVTEDIQQELKSSLKEKGFKEFKIVTNEKDFIDLIPKFDQVWIFSNSEFIEKGNDIEQKFVKSVKQHLKKKRGLMLLTDNHPFYYHANLILKQIPIGYEEQQPVYMACNILKRGVYNQKLEFGEHPITTGLQEIYEGNTICHPKVQNNKNEDSYEDFYDLNIIGTSETKKPCIFVLNGTNKRGRIVFDCGFTKVLSDFWNTTQGTSRYIKNCFAWLYFLDKEES